MSRVIALAVVLIGCGGGGAELECPTAPCGGDPVGEWTIADSCFDGQIEVASCPELEIRSFDASQTGTASINADMTYAIDQRVAGSATLAFPASCFAGGTIRNCSDLNDVGTTCTGDIASECVCDQDLDESVVEAGTWQVSGTTIALSASGPSDYCVSGDTLSLSLGNGSGAAELIMTR